jgi:hypothetical protein
MIYVTQGQVETFIALAVLIFLGNCHFFVLNKLKWSSWGKILILTLYWLVGLRLAFPDMSRTFLALW